MRLQHRLESCLLTDSEYNQGPDAWKSYDDPIHSWEFVEEETELALESA